MLAELVVQNLVIVKHAVLDLGVGLCAITGETGAGKSLLLDALDLLLGGRAQAAQVGPYGEAATVTGVFQLAPDQAMRLVDGIPVADGQLILRRRLHGNGRSQAWINDTPVAIAALKNLAGRLVDIRVQHEHLRLAEPARQCELLDRYGGHVALAESFAAAHQRQRELAGELTRLEHADADSVKELDYLRFLARELDGLDPQPGELAELDARQRLLAGAAQWRDLAAEAATDLADGDDDICRRLSRLARRLQEAPLPALREAAALLAQASDEAGQAARACAAAADAIEADPAELARIDERIAAWQALLRKHGGSEEALLESRRRIQERIGQLDDLDGRRVRTAQELVAANQVRQQAGTALAAARRRAAATLIAQVHAELAELGMPKARLSLHESPADAGALGTVEQSLWVATNPGLPAGPLAAVASGGEAARLTLAMAVVLADAEDTPVLVFDEIDAGVGGRLGGVMGAKLAALAKGRTVLAVTHTAQLAARADRHVLVRKEQGESATAVRVEALAGEARLAELADMLGGGPAARAQAQELLAAPVASRQEAPSPAETGKAGKKITAAAGSRRA